MIAENTYNYSPYGNSICNLIYAMLCTRPGTSFAVETVSRLENTWDLHNGKPLKGSLDTFMGPQALCMTHVGDSRLVGSVILIRPIVRRSISYLRNAFLLGSGAISWYSRKQLFIALYMMDSK